MRRLSAILFVTVFVAGSFARSQTSLGSLYTKVITEDRPVGYWRLNETAGTTAADAMSANAGQYLSGVTLGQPGALVGDDDLAAGFNGTGAKVDVPWSASLNPSTYSFECWAKVATGTDNTHRSPITSRSNSPQQGYIFYAEGGTWQYWTGPAWDNLGSTTAPVVQGQWTHLTGTYDAATKTKRLYYNGQLVATRTNVTATPNGAYALRIGGGATEGTGNYWFRGDIDEVAVYNTALSPGQIATHYATGKTGLLPMAEGSVYHFDENAGTTAYDASSAHANGTLAGAAWTTGKFGSGLAFDGVDDRVSIGNFSAGTYPELSVEAWINLGDKQGKGVLLNEQDSDTLWMNVDTDGGDKLDVYLGDTTNKGYHSSTAAIQRGVWTHVAFTYSDLSDQLQLYINGQPDRTIATSGGLKFDSSATLGMREDLAGDAFKGTLDELAVYRRALSPNEILARYLGGPPIPVPEPSAIALLGLGGVGFLSGRLLTRRRERQSGYCGKFSRNVRTSL
jgi:hypothetical protein